MPRAEARLVWVKKTVGVEMPSDLFLHMPLQYFTAGREDGDRSVVRETGLTTTFVERPD